MSANAYFNEPSYDEQVFNEDLLDVHLSYDYDAEDAQGNPEKWHYELWFPFKVSFTKWILQNHAADPLSQDRCVYKIHGGPMAGRSNFQTCRFPMSKTPRIVAVQLVGRFLPIDFPHCE